MQADYITLSNGIRYRVEVNLNSIEAICAALNIDDFSRIDNLASLKINEVKTLIHCCVAEGERMDGRTLELSATNLAGFFHINTIQEFMTLFNRQATISVTHQKKRLDQKRWMANWWRKQPSTT